ncbi:MAG: NosD domain-containing protein, partial [Candidatus Methanomethylophilaceae archaeon]|nr:NosD domain-containing protein [Candidatus Methanomethylophilaceae archaeon]
MDVSPDLQTRINNANPGDVINVEAGTFGPITINKPLTLIGSGSGTVIDGGSATAIIIASNGVNVSSLSAICGANMVGTITVNGHFNKIDNVTVKNDRSEGWSRYAIHFSSSSSNNSVYDSTVFDSIIGVMADGSHNNTVSGNTFIDNSLEDIRLVSSSDSLVIGNDISAETGVKVWEDSYRNVIDGNLFSFGNTGVLVHDANENAITNNTIVGCRRSIEIKSGSSFNDITNNTISGHDEFAVSITGGQSNLIEGNTIHSGHTGIVIQGPSPGNEIVGNDIFTQGNAIEVHGVGSLSVEDNNLSNNTGYALLIEDSEQLDIQSNEFIQNAVGLHLDNVTGTEIAPIMVQENVFWSNGVGSSSMEATYIIYYENLFWNDTLGLHVDNSSWVLVLLNDFLDEDVAAEVNDSEMVNADHNDVLRCGQGLVFTRTLAPTLLENDILETPYGILLDGCEEAFLEEN